MKTVDSFVNIYLHRDPVDFRKSINGLSVIVEQQMKLSPFDNSLFVFCNRGRDKLKALYWDSTVGYFFLIITFTELLIIRSVKKRTSCIFRPMVITYSGSL